MNMITADFNWFSFLIVIIGAVIGIIKSNKKSIFTFDEEDESDCSVDIDEETKDVKATEILENPNSNQWESAQEIVSDDSDIVNTTDNQEEEQDIEVKRQFDIRQAIISSEILNHPHF